MTPFSFNTPNHRTLAPRPAGGGGPARAAFTLVELLVVVAIIGLLAALIAGLAGRASESKIIKRAEAERDAIVMAIENYKAKLGYYPQDNPADVTKPPLYNELTMTRIPDAYRAQLGVQDIANIGPKAERFLPDVKKSQFTELGRGPRSDDSGTPKSVFVAGLLTFPYGNVPWRYNSSSPTNNPDSFDLWVEVDIGPKKVVIGNWTN